MFLVWIMSASQWLVAGFLRHLLFIDHVLLRRGQRGGVFAPDGQPRRNAGLGRIRDSGPRTVPGSGIWRRVARPGGE